jgi:hypothetical protein
MAVYNCLLLGQFKGAHTVTVQVRYDYNESVVETVTWNGTLAGAHWGGLPNWGMLFGNWGNTTYSTYQFQVNFSNPRHQSVQLTITDGPLTDADKVTQYTAAFDLNGLVFEARELPGPMRLPQANMVASTGGR